MTCRSISIRACSNRANRSPIRCSARFANRGQHEQVRLGFRLGEEGIEGPRGHGEPVNSEAGLEGRDTHAQQIDHRESRALDHPRETAEREQWDVLLVHAVAAEVEGALGEREANIRMGQVGRH